MSIEDTGQELRYLPLFIRYGKVRGDEGLRPLLIFGGKDVSHFFNEQGEVKYHVNPNTNKLDVFMPFGKFIGAPSQEYVAKLYEHRKQDEDNLANCFVQRVKDQKFGKALTECEVLTSTSENSTNSEKSTPWWKSKEYVIGYLTKKPRWIKIKNTMIFKDVDLEVCTEDTIEDILEKYFKFNSHARSYTWRYGNETLDMKQTLENNGIPDTDEVAERLKMNPSLFIPTLNLYFNHDLTEM
ncbi:cytochrome b5 domain-containing protein 1-like [Uloborus diversus]|uniref:cytochrome b5 domain-containing protein 1-like n=1 Tax=Uloborus diversus TaxID=327109 RepID=UPI00240984D3|nr:cytochrome b5 domain-containing protein 1-like [Uloborus diversus]